MYDPFKVLESDNIKEFFPLRSQIYVDLFLALSIVTPILVSESFIGLD